MTGQPVPQTTAEKRERSALAGARAGRGFRYQDAVAAAIAVLGHVTGETWTVGADGDEDVSMSGGAHRFQANTLWPGAVASGHRALPLLQAPVLGGAGPCRQPGERAPGRRPPHARDHRRRGGAALRCPRPRLPVPRPRRHRRGRGRLPHLHVLAGACPGPRRRRRRGPRPLRAHDVARQRRGAPPPRRSTAGPVRCSGTSPRRSPTSGWSTPHTPSPRPSAGRTSTRCRRPRRVRPDRGGRSCSLG